MLAPMPEHSFLRHDAWLVLIVGTCNLRLPSIDTSLKNTREDDVLQSLVKVAITGGVHDKRVLRFRCLW